MARMGPKPGTVQKRPPHDTVTEGGAVGVLLSNRPARVWVDQADFIRIVKAHGNRTWAWVEAAQYVKLKVDQTVSVSVARLVVGEGGRFIRYADGDRLNLRRANLNAQDAMMPVERAKRAATATRIKRRPPKVGRIDQAPAQSFHTRVIVQNQRAQAVITVKRTKRPM